jgi:hypothetical protein
MYDIALQISYHFCSNMGVTNLFPCSLNNLLNYTCIFIDSNKDTWRQSDVLQVYIRYISPVCLSVHMKQLHCAVDCDTIFSSTNAYCTVSLTRSVYKLLSPSLSITPSPLSHLALSWFCHPLPHQGTNRTLRRGVVDTQMCTYNPPTLCFPPPLIPTPSPRLPPILQ